MLSANKIEELNKKKITFCNYTTENTRSRNEHCHSREARIRFPHEKQATIGPCLFG